jgi:para-nitrobenzyl esterase
MTCSMGRIEGRTRFLVMAVTLLLSSALPTSRDGRPTAQGSCFVTLPAGDVQGADLGASCAFFGIPYADTTAASNRWRPPQPAAPWAPTLLTATTPPVTCPAVGVVGPPSLSGHENCLKLNIWVADPLPATPAPVIVWLHTGAFVVTSANFPGSNGQKLAELTGAIVVAPNYRLGPFGFLVHTALAAEDPDGSSGNYGLLDQRAALQWVRDNIGQFGGDPDNVTLAGTSAGGQSVGLHLASPGSAGLFHRAIVQSAYPTSRWTTMSEAAADGDALAAALGCTNQDAVQAAACLRSKTQNEVLAALPVGVQQVAEPPGRVFWEPVVDGLVIPDQPRTLFEAGAFHRVPTIVGFNRDEGWGAFITRSFSTGVSLAQYEAWVLNEFGPDATDVLGLYPADLDPATSTPPPIEAMAQVTGDVQFVCEARRLARAIERTGTPTYLYSYEHEIDTLSPDHVIHGVESNILFGNDYRPAVFPNYVLNVEDRALHAQMAGYWTRFAATGNPNRGDDSAYPWPPFKRPDGNGRGNDKYIVLAPVIGEAARTREARCDFFEPLFLRSVLSGLPAAAQ